MKSPLSTSKKSALLMKPSAFTSAEGSSEKKASRNAKRSLEVTVPSMLKSAEQQRTAPNWAKNSLGRPSAALKAPAAYKRGGWASVGGNATSWDAPTGERPAPTGSHEAPFHRAILSAGMPPMVANVPVA